MLSKRNISILVALLVLIGVGVYLFSPKHYPSVLLPKLSYEEHQKRCTAHKSDQDCSADPYCEGVEVTPVCINGKDGQVCLDGGYVCHPKSELTKQEKNPYPTNVSCNGRTTPEHCQTTTDCKWEEQPGGAKCIFVSEERQDL